MAFATFVMFFLFNMLRVNLFLRDLMTRSDWQHMVSRFLASGHDNLRTFINLDYLKGAPLKIGAASVIGAVMGLMGGTLGRWRSTSRSVSAQV